MLIHYPGVPAFIVSISLAVTRLQGFGDTESGCWLSVDNGLIWAFAAPAAVIILVRSGPFDP